ncbi:uncharacterized protein LOC135169012 [Diachasmimorpha longicaudata]|uniref:uncharacterized protein LOC135169012 n=1 Tax=Diachasmimorpha longicaudata TaxID=58733 RepID=UPI0030B8A086
MKSILWTAFFVYLVQRESLSYEIEITVINSEDPTYVVTYEETDKPSAVTLTKDRYDSWFSAKIHQWAGMGRTIKGRTCFINDKTDSGFIAKIMQLAMNDDASDNNARNCTFAAGERKINRKFSIDSDALSDHLPKGFEKVAVGIDIYDLDAGNNWIITIFWAIRIYESRDN